MRFSTILSNPPYNNSLDIKILSSVLSLSDELVFVHPITWLIEKKNVFKTIRDEVSNRLVSVDIFNGNPIFNIAIYVECAITKFSSFNNGIIRVDLDTYRNIHSINKYGNDSLYFSVEKKILDNIENNVWNKRIKGADSSKTEDFWVSLSGGRAHVEQFDINEPIFRKSDYYTICNRALKPLNYRATHHNWKFATATQAQNFIDYLNTKFARFCLSLTKNNMHIDNGELRTVPWMDFTRKWTDIDLANHIGITGTELEWILSKIPNYYDQDFE